MMRPTTHLRILALIAACGCGGPPGGPRQDLAGTSRAARGPSQISTLASVKPRSEADPVAASIEPAHTRVLPGDTFQLYVRLDIVAFYEIHPQVAQPPDVPTEVA